MEFVDTHCHIQEASTDEADDAFVRDKWARGGFTDPKQLISGSVEAGVTKLICVGCTLKDSQMAVELAKSDAHCYASIGIHPHEAKDHQERAKKDQFAALLEDKTVNKIVAIGECGLDYFYTHSPKEQQIELLRFQLELAQEHDLPVIFHVRDALQQDKVAAGQVFDDFWPIFDEFRGLRGVIHSFSATIAVLEKILSRGLYVGLNGIMTFSKDENQLAAAKAVPLEKLVLETDAPFLTPHPYRGKICQPKHVVETAKFLSELRKEPVKELAEATTRNAAALFNL